MIREFTEAAFPWIMTGLILAVSIAALSRKTGNNDLIARLTAPRTMFVILMIANLIHHDDCLLILSTVSAAILIVTDIIISHRADKSREPCVIK